MDCCEIFRLASGSSQWAAVANSILARGRQPVFGSADLCPATAGKLRLLDDVLDKRQLNPRKAPSFIKQELARFSNDQRFVHCEHVMAGVMQFDDSRVLHA